MLIRFGKFELDSRRYQLTCEGRAIKLEPIPMKLLFYLAESKGALVSRQAITEHLWGKDVFVDAQHSVNTAINKLRTALNDDLADPRFIQTVKVWATGLSPKSSSAGTQTLSSKRRRSYRLHPTGIIWRPARPGLSHRNLPQV